MSFFGEKLNNTKARNFFLNLYSEMQKNYLISRDISFETFFTSLKRGFFTNQKKYYKFFRKLVFFSRKAAWYVKIKHVNNHIEEREFQT